jgi:hypothetical protein
MEQKRSRPGLWLGLAFGAFALCGIGMVLAFTGAGAGLFLALGAYEYAAAPLGKLPPHIESNEAVIAALGAPVEVSMVVTRRLDHSHGSDGSESVRLDTSVSGSRREARLTASATNVNDQGWAGSWEVRGEPTRVLRDGQYVTEGDEVIASGRFAPDGTPTE